MVRVIHGERAFGQGVWRRCGSASGRLAADRRGVTAMFFAVIAVGLLGFVSLATEVGTWYLTRSAADNAADASAMAAALAISNGASTSDAQAAATDTATDNGYTTGGAVTVTPNIPPATGNYRNNNAAAEVLINVTVTPILASLFGSGTPTVASRSVAIVQGVGNACVLSTIGDLQITEDQGSLSLSSDSINCMYASNASGSTAVNIPSASIDAYGVTSVGSCTGCGNAGRLLRPPASYQPPTIDPYATPIAQMTLPTSFTSIVIPSSIPTNFTLVPATASGTFNTNTYAWASGQPFYAYTSNLEIPAGTTLTLVPGTYFFVNASLLVDSGSGTTIKCAVSVAPNAGSCTPASQGVTLIFMGSPTGKLMIPSTAAVNLTALANQTSSTFANSSGLGSEYSALDGILFYRTGQATVENVGAPGVSITGGSATTLNGAMYFPNSYVSYGANGSGNGPTCSVMVAGYLSLANVPSQFAASHCHTTYNIEPPQVQAVQVVE